MVVKFSRNLSVAFRDRGMGRGDFGVMQGERLVARIECIGIEFQPGVVRELLPALENAYLFSASPNLFDACEAALRHIKVTTKDAAVIALLEEARNKALPPTEEAEDSFES